MIYIDQQMRYDIVLGASGVVKTLQDINKEMKEIQKSAAGIGNAKGMSRFQASYQVSLNQMTREAEKFHKLWKETGDIKARNNFEKMIPGIQRMQNEFNNFSKSIRGAEHSALSLSNKLKSHLHWSLAGGILVSLAALPISIANVSRETEVLNQKLAQNLHLSEQYHNNNQLLEQDLQSLRNVASLYAMGMGADLKDVMDTMVLLSRRFKDLNQISALTHMALVMNKLDFLDLKEGANSLESVILQYNLNARQTRDFLNDLSVTVHISNVNAQELMQGLQRSGSSFAQFQMGVRESIAAVAALRTETARTGAVIGNTFKSVAANFSMEKALTALDAYGIKLYETQENGTKILRQGANIFMELQDLFQKLDDEGRQKLALSISGGKPKLAA